MSSITAGELAMHVEPLYEHDGCTFGWWVKGHYDKELFLAAVDWYEGGKERIDADSYQQCYWRCVPVMDYGEYDGMRFENTKPGRGAFPATFCYHRRGGGE